MESILKIITTVRHRPNVYLSLYATTSHCHCTDKGLSYLTRIFRKTDVLKLTKLQAITSKGLKTIATRSLKCVDLSESNKITDDGMIEFVHNCSNIEILTLCELGKLTDKSLTQVAKTLREKLVSCSDT